MRVFIWKGVVCNSTLIMSVAVLSVRETLQFAAHECASFKNETSKHHELGRVIKSIMRAVTLILKRFAQFCCIFSIS
jgi:hypothetical protein